jgi:hypothetical protein
MLWVTVWCNALMQSFDAMLWRNASLRKASLSEHIFERRNALTQRRFVEQCFELHEPFRLSDWMPNPKLPNAGIDVLIPAWQLS